MKIKSNSGNLGIKCYLDNKFRVRKFMKLFKSLLVTQAVLGLLTPMTAAASEINLVEMNNYAKKSSFKKRFNTKTFTNQNLQKQILLIKYKNGN